jgi:vacuolar-type H+-ATPase subunit B/Vma2
MVTYAHDLRRLTAALGDVPLRHLTPGLIQSAYASLLEMGFSKRTMKVAVSRKSRRAKPA